MINPYDTLGVKEDANQEEIKKAYYDKAKDHHPDKGGDPKQFALVKLSYDTLKDKKKRKTYDEKGFVDNMSESQKTDQYKTILQQLFLQVISKTDPKDVGYIDIIGDISNAIDTSINNFDVGIEQLKQSFTATKEAISKLEDKLKRKGNKPNFLLALLVKSVNDVPNQILNLKMQKDIYKEVKKLLKEFSYNYEIKEQTNTFNGVRFNIW